MKTRLYATPVVKGVMTVQQKYRKDVVLAGFFCIAYLKVKDTIHRMLSDRFQLSTPELCKNKRTYFFAVNILFRVLDISRFKKELVWVSIKK